MSRRSYIVNATPSDKPQFLVTAGWDRPLHYFFLDILLLPMFRDEEDLYLFNNLDDPKYPLGHMTIAEIREELESRRIPYPPTFFRDLLADEHDPMTGKVDVSYRDLWMPGVECEKLKEKVLARLPNVVETDLF